MSRLLRLAFLVSVGAWGLSQGAPFLAGDTIQAVSFSSRSISGLDVGSDYVDVGANNDATVPLGVQRDSLVHWIKFDEVDFSTGGFTRLVALGSTDGTNCGYKILFKLDSLSTAALCTLKVSICTGWTPYVPQLPATLLSDPVGVHALYVIGYAIDASNDSAWQGGILNLHDFVFTKVTATHNPLKSVDASQMSIVPLATGLSVTMPQSGAYHVSLRSLDGRLISSRKIRNGASTVLPFAGPAGSYLVTVGDTRRRLSRIITLGR